jgi:hypothetical protein
MSTRTTTRAAADVQTAHDGPPKGLKAPKISLKSRTCAFPADERRQMRKESIPIGAD